MFFHFLDRVSPRMDEPKVATYKDYNFLTNMYPPMKLEASAIDGLNSFTKSY